MNKEFKAPLFGEYTDSGNALAFVNTYQDKILHCDAIGWLVWDECRFKPDKHGAVKLAMNWTNDMMFDAFDNYDFVKEKFDTEKKSGEVSEKTKKELEKAESYRKHAIQSRNKTKMFAFLAIAESLCSIDIDELDKDPYLLSTPFGCYDLQTGNLIKADPKKRCTKTTAVSPDSKNMEMWMNFLNLFTDGDTELQEYFQYYFGMSLIGKVTNLGVGILFLYGIGNSGKSSFLNTIGYALGDYFVKMDDDLFVKEGGNRDPRFKLSSLRGARLCVVGEMGEGAVLLDSALKNYASGDRIGSEKKGKDRTEFTPSHNTVCATNNLPLVKAMDSGAWRRLKVAPCNHKFSGKNDDPTFADRLKEEAAPAALKWAIDGAKKFIDNGDRLPDCKAVQQAGGVYKNREDQVLRFIEERAVRGDYFSCRAAELFSHYKNWCIDTGEKPKTQTGFGICLNRLGIEKGKDRKGCFYRDIRVKEPEDFLS